MCANAQQAFTGQASTIEDPFRTPQSLLFGEGHTYQCGEQTRAFSSQTGATQARRRCLRMPSLTTPEHLTSGALRRNSVIKTMSSGSLKCTRGGDGALGERIAPRSVNSCIDPAGRPINTSMTKVLRRSVESALRTSLRVEYQAAWHTVLAPARVQQEVRSHRTAQPKFG